MPDGSKAAVILDTKIWFIACGENIENSPIDIEGIQATEGSEKARGAIFRQLIVSEILVPKRVETELRRLQLSGKTHAQNNGNMDRLLKIFRHRTEKFPVIKNILARKWVGFP